MFVIKALRRPAATSKQSRIYVFSNLSNRPEERLDVSMCSPSVTLHSVWRCRFVLNEYAVHILLRVPSSRKNVLFQNYTEHFGSSDGRWLKEIDFMAAATHDFS